MTGSPVADSLSISSTLTSVGTGVCMCWHKVRSVPGPSPCTCTIEEVRGTRRQGLGNLWMRLGEHEDNCTFSFCRPSLGPTSTIFTLSGREPVDKNLTCRYHNFSTRVTEAALASPDGSSLVSTIAGTWLARFLQIMRSKVDGRGLLAHAYIQIQNINISDVIVMRVVLQ